MDLTNEIPEAMSRPGSILVPNLSGYKCIPNTDPAAFYDIVFYSGGFCQSYPLSKAGTSGRKCLRLWVNDGSLKSNLQHVKRISKYFAEHWVEYVVNYEYYDSALRLKDGTILPGVVMDWVEGDTLMSYVKSNYRSSSKILNIAREFLAMERYLDKNGLAHGDLSGDNIIVDSSGKLILIDYDSFYVNNLTQNVIQSTAGIACFQHPGRVNNKYLTRTMDNFSQLVIYCSLLGIARQPSLFNPDTDKGLLFQIEDMTSAKTFTSSLVYKKLHACKDEEINHYLSVIESALNGSFRDVSSLIDSLYLRKETAIALQSFCQMCGTKFASSDQMYCRQCGTKRGPVGLINHNTNNNSDYLLSVLLSDKKVCSACHCEQSEGGGYYCGNCGKPLSRWNEKETAWQGTEKAIKDLKTQYVTAPKLSTGFKLIWKAIKGWFTS